MAVVRNEALASGMSGNAHGILFLAVFGLRFAFMLDICLGGALWVSSRRGNEGAGRSHSAGIYTKYASLVLPKYRRADVVLTRQERAFLQS